MSIIEKLSTTDKLVKLVQAKNFVGWVYNIDYDKALIMTNDLWKENVNGIPHNSFCWPHHSIRKNMVILVKLTDK